MKRALFLWCGAMLGAGPTAAAQVGAAPAPREVVVEVVDDRGTPIFDAFVIVQAFGRYDGRKSVATDGRGIGRVALPHSDSLEIVVSSPTYVSRTLRVASPVDPAFVHRIALAFAEEPILGNWAPRDLPSLPIPRADSLALAETIAMLAPDSVRPPVVRLDRASGGWATLLQRRPGIDVVSAMRRGEIPAGPYPHLRVAAVHRIAPDSTMVQAVWTACHGSTVNGVPVVHQAVLEHLLVRTANGWTPARRQFRASVSGSLPCAPGTAPSR